MEGKCKSIFDTDTALEFWVINCYILKGPPIEITKMLCALLQHPLIFPLCRSDPFLWDFDCAHVYTLEDTNTRLQRGTSFSGLCQDWREKKPMQIQCQWHSRPNNKLEINFLALNWLLKFLNVDHFVKHQRALVAD